MGALSRLQSYLQAQYTLPSWTFAKWAKQFPLDLFGMVPGLTVGTTSAIPSPAWNSGTTYNLGDKVTSGFLVYESLQGGNLNHVPGASPTWWTVSIDNQYPTANGDTDGEFYVSSNVTPPSVFVWRTNTWYELGGGGSGGSAPPYTLPIASNTVLGGIKVGSHLQIDVNGVLSTDSTVWTTSNLTKVVTLAGQNLAGFLNRTTSTLSFNNGTRVLTFTPVGTCTIWTNDTRYDKTVPETITIANTVGEHFVYFDSTGTLQQSTTPWDITSDQIATVALIYWAGSVGTLSDERHGAYRNRNTHVYLHNTRGTAYDNGFTGTFTDTTLSVTQGTVWDEDIKATTGVAPITTARVWYRSGGGATMVFENLTTPYKDTAGVLQYDNAGTLTNVTSGSYVTNWLYVTTDIDSPIYVVVSQAQYGTLTAARAAAQPSFPNLTTREWKLAYAVIYRYLGGNINYIESADYRTTSQLPGATIVSVPASQVTLSPVTGITATNVQAAFTQVLPLAGGTLTGPLIGTTGTFTSLYANYFDTNIAPAAPAYQEGRVFWDKTDHTLAYYSDVPNVTVNMGQEVLVRVLNKTGVLIPNGKVVFVNGAQGKRPTIALATATVALDSERTIGVVTADIADNAEGYVCITGLVHDVDTSGMVAGDQIWLSTTPGSFTTTRPAQPNHGVRLGHVVEVSPSQGVILVTIQHDTDLADQDDVTITTPLNDQVLAYETASGLWKNKAFTATLTAPYTLTGVGDTIPLTINGIAGQTAKLQSWQVNGVEKTYFNPDGTFAFIGTNYRVSTDTAITGIPHGYLAVVNDGSTWKSYSGLSGSSWRLGDLYNGVARASSNTGTTPPAWNSGTTYVIGDRVTDANRNYTSLINGNLNNTPTPGGDANWADEPAGTCIRFSSTLHAQESSLADFEFAPGTTRTAGNIFKVESGGLPFTVAYDGGVTSDHLTATTGVDATPLIAQGLNIGQTAKLQIWKANGADRGYVNPDGTFTFTASARYALSTENAVTGNTNGYLYIVDTLGTFTPFTGIERDRIKMGDTYNANITIRTNAGTVPVTWNVGTTYNTDDRVTYSGRTYTSSGDNNTGNTPAPGGTAFWNDIASGVGLTFISSLNVLESLKADFTFQNITTRTTGHLLRVVAPAGTDFEIGADGFVTCGGISSNGADVVTLANIASATDLGVIKVGANLSIDGNGVLSATGGGGITAPYTLNGVGDTVPFTINAISGQTANLQSWQVNGVERANIASTGGATFLGNVGIGAAPTGGRLHLQGDTHTIVEIDGTLSGRVRLAATTASSGNRNFEFQSNAPGAGQAGTFRLSSLNDGWSIYTNQYILNAGSSGVMSFNSATLTNAGYYFVSPMANGASAVGFMVDTGVAYTTTAKLFSIRNNGTEKLAVNQDGGVVSQGSVTAQAHLITTTGVVYSGDGKFASNTSGNSAEVRGYATDGAAAVAVKINNLNTLSITGSKLLSIQNNAVEKAYFDFNGYLTCAGTFIRSIGINGTSRAYPSGSQTNANQIFEFIANSDINNSPSLLLGIGNGDGWATPLSCAVIASTKNGIGVARDLHMWAAAPTNSNMSLTLQANTQLVGVNKSSPGAALDVRSVTADGATAIALKVDTSTAWANATAKLVSINNNGSEKLYINTAGSIVSTSTIRLNTGNALYLNGASLTAGVYADANSTVHVRGAVADGASAVGVVLNADTTLSTSGSKILSVRNNTVERFFVDYRGTVVTGDPTAVSNFTTICDANGDLRIGSSSVNRIYLSQNSITTFGAGYGPAGGEAGIKLGSSTYSYIIGGTNLLLQPVSGNGNVGIGPTLVPGAKLTVTKDTSPANQSALASTLIFASDNPGTLAMGAIVGCETGAGGPALNGMKGRGTCASPSASVDNDILMAFSGYGWDTVTSATWKFGAAVTFRRDTGTGSTDRIPGKILFNTAPGGADNNIYTRMLIGSTGLIGVNTTTLTTAGIYLKGTMANGASAIATAIDTDVSYSTAGAKLLSIRNNGTEKAAVDLNGLITSNGNAVMRKVAVPTTATSSGTVGDFAVDANYAYFCTATDTWVRCAVASW